MEYRPYTEQIIRCIRRWSPEHIPYSSPFIGCLILGPAAIHVRVAKGIRDAVNDGNESQYVEAHLLELTLGHIARYWGIGSAILGKAYKYFLSFENRYLTISIRSCYLDGRFQFTGP